MLKTIAVAAFVCSTLLYFAGASTPPGDAIELGDRQLGERCSKDCQCASLECKGFKCVVRDYTKHPILDTGASCAFDGDCKSCDCDRGRCR